MNIQSINATSAQFYKNFTSHKKQIQADTRTNLSGSGENFSDTLALTQTAQNKYTELSKSISASGQESIVIFDTNQGAINLDIDAYFSNNRNANNASSLLQTLPPLLLPTQNNIDALSNHISATFPQFLTENNIPSAPSSISYDSNGQIQLPSDYAYTSELKQALANNPALSAQLSTVHALTSHFSGIQKSMSFQQEYRAAATQTEVDATVARYHYLFSGNRSFNSKPLLFTEDGHMKLSQDSKP